MTAPELRVRDDEAIIVGSGIGGLVCALSLAPRSVTVITKTAELEGGSSIWAQGGIAAAMGPGDSPADHAADTVAAGAGLSDAGRARHLTEAGIAAIDWLIREGVPFDRGPGGELQFGREAAHGRPRIVHAGGDATGFVVMEALIRRVRETASIDVLEHTFAADLVVRDGRICGVLTHNAADGWVLHRAPVVVLATGGIGMTWSHTTNPVEATGDGLAMAARAGAALSDLEFVQFHPTALAAEAREDGGNLPLLTEALRGAGAQLVDERGERFMVGRHPAAELAPRDVVAAAIHEQLAAGHGVFLDIRPVLAGPERDHFPTAVRFAREAGLDPEREPLPVAPAAHYHMGGVAIDDSGRSSIDGLWACGEVATTGVHGANRLASNSLLEALVFARSVAADIAANDAGRGDCPAPDDVAIPAARTREEIERIAHSARECMSQHVGIVRDAEGLASALETLRRLAADLESLRATGEGDQSGDREGSDDPATLVRLFGEARNRVLVGRLVALAALRREESRGAHRRRDFPEPDPAWQRSQVLTAQSLAASP